MITFEQSIPSSRNKNLNWEDVLLLEAHYQGYGKDEINSWMP